MDAMRMDGRMQNNVPGVNDKWLPLLLSPLSIYIITLTHNLLF